MIRTYLFNFLMFFWAFFYFVLGSPILILPPRFALKSCQIWGKCVVFALRWVGGVRTEIRGLHNLPKETFIIASKHQSEWETLVLGYTMSSPVFVLKKELLSVPFFGWFMRRTNMIAVDRKAKGGVMRQMLNKARPHIQKGDNIIIFPEGTRIPPGETGKYKHGIAVLYEDSKIPVVPVAVNSGFFWSKNKILRQGTAVLEFLEPIQPGLSNEEFIIELEKRIEIRSLELLEEAKRSIKYSW